MLSFPGFTVLAIIALAACTGVSRTPAVTPVAATGPVAAPVPTRHEPPRVPDPDLNRPPPRKLLDIDWAKLALTDDDAALALWHRIAPTGADWEDKLQEVPATAAPALAVALLRGGNFLCTPPPSGTSGACATPAYDVAPPADAAGFDDPCLRRVLALWSIEQIVEDDKQPAVQDALRSIAGLPPPESQLVAAAVFAVPETDQDARLAVIARAWRAGQRDVVAEAVGTLDEPHLFAAVRQYHIDSALEVLSAEAHRAIYLGAVGDEALGARARILVIGELAALDDKLAPDLAAALIAAVASRDCGVAAAAARALDQHGDHRFLPRRPRTANPALLMRALCVLASYEDLLHNDEVSLLPTYLPARGLERMTITYDPLSEDDADGDGDPHTTHTAELVPRDEAVLPEIEDLVRAMQHCTGTICVSEDHEFRFQWTRSGELSRIELADRPPCPATAPPGS